MSGSKLPIELTYTRCQTNGGNDKSEQAENVEQFNKYIYSTSTVRFIQSAMAGIYESNHEHVQCLKWMDRNHNENSKRTEIILNTYESHLYIPIYVRHRT